MPSGARRVPLPPPVFPLLPLTPLCTDLWGAPVDLVEVDRPALTARAARTPPPAALLLPIPVPVPVPAMAPTLVLDDDLYEPTELLPPVDRMLDLPTDRPIDTPLRTDLAGEGEAAPPDLRLRPPAPTPARYCGRRRAPVLLVPLAAYRPLVFPECLLRSNCCRRSWNAAPWVAAAAFRAPAPVGAAFRVRDTGARLEDDREDRATPALGSDAPARLLVEPPVLPSRAASVRRRRSEAADDRDARLPRLADLAEPFCTGLRALELAALSCADTLPLV